MCWTPRTAAISSIKRHTAFGEVLSAGLPSGFLESSSEESLASLSSVSCPWGYFSKRLDPDLGLIDFGKRWYDPQQARWTTLDPAGFIDGTNLYRFVRNNPLLYTDPDGQFAIVIPLITLTIEGIAWLCSTEAVIAITTTAVAAYGAYRAREYIKTSLEEQREREYQEEMLQRRYFKDDQSAAATEDDGPDRPGKPPRYRGTPGELANNPDWENITHPEAAATGRRTFKNKKTGQVIHYDDGKPGEPRYGGRDHYHIPNPDATNRHDAFIDAQGNPCGKYRDSYHLLPPEGVEWEKE